MSDYTKNFEQLLINHCAPTLKGLKSSNMININKADFPNIEFEINCFNENSQNLKIKILCNCNKKILILLYNPSMLSIQLSKDTHIKLLKKFNYSFDAKIDILLDELSYKISVNKDFPHEIGLFLGYPIEDVIGFIEFKGANFKLCGYWKVYGDENKARFLFTCYNYCKNFAFSEFKKGKDIYQIIKCA